MGKLLWTADAEHFDSTHPGCMSGVFHALDYQYWHSNVKKILPHRKHAGLVNSTKGNRRPGGTSNDQDSFQVLELPDGERSPIRVDESTQKPTSTHKRSIKVRLKALVSEETLKDNRKERGPGFLPHSRLQRTYSIHHLESDEWVHPIIFFPENLNVEEVSKKETVTPVSSKEPGQDDTNCEIDDYVNISQNFKVKKDLFPSILQDGSQVSDMKAKLMKSGSFPSAYKSGRRNLRPTKLKHKLNEFYSVSRNKKMLDNWAPKLDLSYLGSLTAELDKQGGKNSDDDLKNSNFMPIRRISSLDEFANRHALLFDYSSTKKDMLRRSRSLTNESENSLSAQAPNFFRRFRSLPHLDDPNQESHDTHFLRTGSQNERNPVSVPSSTEKHIGLDATEGTKCLNGMIDRSDICPKNEHSDFRSVGLTDVGKGLREDIYALPIEEEGNQQLNPVLVPECCSQVNHQSEFQISEGLEPLRVIEENIENKIKSVKSNRCIELSKEHNHDDDYFNYAREILERSGFVKNGFQQTWYSSNQPLDPSVFQEIESQYPHDLECFKEELIELSHHLLRFDLVDEALLKIYERSFSYYPKALSCSCHLRPAPTGKLVLEEVWKSVSRLLNLKPDMNQSSDSIVSQDLGVGNGWMNLQLESECIALELEDLIFDELLEEAFS